MAETYDVIIIGAGHNGLVAAAYLAKAGRKVLVLEQRAVVGGAAASEYIFPGYKFNTGALDAGLFLPRIVKELSLEERGLVFLQGQAAAFAPQPDGSALTLWREPDASQADIERFSPEDAQKYPAFVEQMQTLGDSLAIILERTPPDLGNTRSTEMLTWLQAGLKFRRSGGERMVQFMRVLPMPARDFLDEWFESQALKGALAVPSLAGGMPGPYAAGTTLMMLYQQLGGANGGYRGGRFVQGGAGRLSTVLAETARGYGAEIRLGAAVDHIVLDDERARGVVLAEGDAIGSNVVMSSVDPRRTFFQLVGGAHLEPGFMREIKNIRYRGVTAKVNLALDGLPEFRGAADADRLSGYIVIGPSLDYLERASDAGKYGRLSDRPVLEATIPTILDPDLAPADHHVMSINVWYAPYHLRDGDWDEQREALGDKVVETLADYSPDLPGRILQRHVLTPLDLEREYGLTEGQSHHGQMGLDQLLIMRPAPGYARYRTPFENLYLCGAGAHPGGGVSGAPGYNAAREVQRDL
jgi:phytoene dehydrogenase-like protein